MPQYLRFSDQQSLDVHETIRRTITTIDIWSAYHDDKEGGQLTESEVAERYVSGKCEQQRATQPHGYLFQYTE